MEIIKETKRESTEEECGVDETDCLANENRVDMDDDQMNDILDNTGGQDDIQESRDIPEVDDTQDGHFKPVLNNNFILPMETEDVRTEEQIACGDKDLKKTKREKKNGRFYKFVKKHFLHRKGSSNDVREIHILPEGDEHKWARRSGGSAASRSSEETINSEEDRLEVVHDMAEEEMEDV